MARNGGAQKKLIIQTPSTVRDTCIEAKTVQESLWKFLLLPLLLLLLLQLLLMLAITVLIAVLLHWQT
ncbi:hypothetical protein LINPERHAP1_LOCUS16901 [Linum perenne]